MSDQGQPGWHPAPDRPGQQRYWDGSAWTDHYSGGGPAPGPPPGGYGYASGPGGYGSAPSGPPRTDALAIVALVLGFVPCIAVASIVLGFISRSRIKRSRGALKGKGMALAGILLGFLQLVGVVALVVLAASGVFENENVDKFPDGEEREIAELVDRTEQAFDDRDVTEFCNELITADFRQLLDLQGGCGNTLPEEWRAQAELVIQTLDVTGTTATARVKEKDEVLTFSFVQVDGQWRIDQLSL